MTTLQQPHINVNLNYVDSIQTPTKILEFLNFQSSYCLEHLQTYCLWLNFNEFYKFTFSKDIYKYEY